MRGGPRLTAAGRLVGGRRLGGERPRLTRARRALRRREGAALTLRKAAERPRGRALGGRRGLALGGERARLRLGHALRLRGERPRAGRGGGPTGRLSALERPGDLGMTGPGRLALGRDAAEDLAEDRAHHDFGRGRRGGQVTGGEAAQPLPAAEAGDRRTGGLGPARQRGIDAVNRQRGQQVGQRQVVPAGGGQPGQAFADPVEPRRAERLRQREGGPPPRGQARITQHLGHLLRAAPAERRD
ncbi:hypothetical protein ACFQYP_07440 [Nonomuraea antimicrobica]